MATLNPLSLIRKIFPTARRLLVEKDVNRWCTNDYRRVLVIGAGHDPYKKHFSGAELYIALDIVAFPGATDVIADAVALPLGNNTFDCVVAFEVMEHIKNPVELIEEAYRILAPGGTLLLSVPFAFHQHGDPCDYWRPTQYTLETITSKFSSSSVLLQGNRLHVISDLITTALYPYSIFFLFRILNHILVPPFMWSSRGIGGSSAPSGFFLIARK
jgi:SAM-dependent methyltransferase